MSHRTSHGIESVASSAVRRGRMLASGLVLSAVVALSGGCSDAQGGALLGAGVGALAGQAIGGNTKGTLIGTAIGTAVGYGVGNESDKTRIERRRSGNYSY
jgi:outer membrane lipoprotein SlyB